LRSFLRMLLVAGVFTLSLAAFQEKAGAEAMVSSWYGPGLEGNLTASGEAFDPYNDRTAASLYYPMGTKLRVCYAECTVARVNDLGPYVGGVDLDLSQAAAEEIGLSATGTDVVDVRVLQRRSSSGGTFTRAV
jgi:rare lipoprotein A